MLYLGYPTTQIIGQLTHSKNAHAGGGGGDITHQPTTRHLVVHATHACGPLDRCHYFLKGYGGLLLFPGHMWVDVVIP